MQAHSVSHILVAPISGGCFPVQLASVEMMAANNYRPKLVCAGSGGCPVVYTAEAGDWSPSGINRVASTLQSDVFIEPWENSHLQFMPSFVIGYFSGAMYKISSRSEQYFSQFFTSKSVQNLEIWVGAVNRSTGRVALFCNRTYESAVIKGEHFDMQELNAEPLKYLAGNLSHITKSILSSASVPMMAEAVEIDGAYYHDCGKAAGSPFTYLQEEIRMLSDRLHITYLSGYNVEARLMDEKQHMNLSDIGSSSFSHLARRMVHVDRHHVINLLKSLTKDRYLNYIESDVDNLSDILVRREQSTSSLLEFYPVKTSPLDLTSFTGEDVLRKMNKAKSVLRLRFFWIGHSTMFDDITGIIRQDYTL